mmetsp:Transcript_19942/g.51427  ORF Transcript_19942/g.51427 Transcript_19942/m.51427 type:complete len:287 (-) Transcript_19942:300-1160(-)
MAPRHQQHLLLQLVQDEDLDHRRRAADDVRHLPLACQPPGVQELQEGLLPVHPGARLLRLHLRLPRLPHLLQVVDQLGRHRQAGAIAAHDSHQHVHVARRSCAARERRAPPLRRPGEHRAGAHPRRARLRAASALPHPLPREVGARGRRQEEGGVQADDRRGRRGRQGGWRARRRRRARVLLRRRVRAPGDPHDRVRARLDLEHRVVPASLGPLARALAAVGALLGRHHGDGSARCRTGQPGDDMGGRDHVGVHLLHGAHGHGEPLVVPPRAPSPVGRVPGQVLHG